ncbi:hypothetical protein ACFFIS_03470 [Virgibacillus soli]
MEKIWHVLEQYSIRPDTIEQVTDRVYKIKVGQQVYALKRSNLTEQTVKNLENFYHVAYYERLPLVLPVYLTVAEKLYAELDNEFYYIAPWIEQEEHHRQQDFYTAFFRSIGQFHHKTMQKHTFSVDKIKSSFTSYKIQCQTDYKKLLSMVERFEHHPYMSPFELLVCSQFHYLEYVFKNLERAVDEFLECEMDAWRTSLCHGKLEQEYLFYREYFWVINWEHVRNDNPISDLHYYLTEQANRYDIETTSIFETFHAYMEENELRREELHLLSIYLLNPQKYIETVLAYVEKGNETDMIGFIQKLQQAFRNLRFGLEWTDFVKETYIYRIDLESKEET